MLILSELLKFFDGGIWRVDFVDGGGESLEL